MSLRARCPACQASFLAPDEGGGRSINCPKCGARLKLPAPPVAASETPAPSSLADTLDAEERRGRRRLLKIGVPVALLVALVMAVLVFLPYLRKQAPGQPPPPPDPIVSIASTYLDALTKGDRAAADRLGTVATPPAIDGYRQVERDPTGEETVQGPFAPVADLNATIEEKFTYNPRINRYENRDPLGPAADSLDALHDAKAQAEQEKLYEKMASADLDEVVDSVTQFGEVFTRLAEETLAPEKLAPTYAQLVESAEPPLPPEAQRLALDYGENRETWDTLLKRPFATLKADGPFRLERAEVTALVQDRLASSGAPPSRLRLTLTRFQLEGIDTGWKVTSARRDRPEAPEPTTEPTGEPESRTPTTPSSPGLLEP